VSYFPVDDGFAFHPKAIAAGNEACGMWVRAGAWSKANTTGGVVPREIVRVLGSKRAADRLVAVGLWVESPEAYYFHDWTDQAGNDVAGVEKERRDRNRERNRERQRRHRERNADRNGVTNAPVTTTPSPSPRPTDVTVTESQSRSEDGQDVTDSSPSTPFLQRHADRLGLLDVPRIVAHIQEQTGRTITGDRAIGVASWLLDKAKNPPRAPQSYVMRAITMSAFEVQQHIDGEAA
jgi:hypothetical protein